VAWTAGNVSARVRGTELDGDLMVIKPSGIAYDELTPARTPRLTPTSSK